MSRALLGGLTYKRHVFLVECVTCGSKVFAEMVVCIAQTGFWCAASLPCTIPCLQCIARFSYRGGGVRCSDGFGIAVRVSRKDIVAYAAQIVMGIFLTGLGGDFAETCFTVHGTGNAPRQGVSGRVPEGYPAGGDATSTSGRGDELRSFPLVHAGEATPPCSPHRYVTLYETVLMVPMDG